MLFIEFVMVRNEIFARKWSVKEFNEQRINIKRARVLKQYESFKIFSCKTAVKYLISHKI